MQKNTVLENYKSLDKASEATKEELSGDEPIYELNTEDEEKIDDLNLIFGKPMLIVSGLNTDSDQTKVMKRNY